MGRGTEALHYGRNGFVADEAELYSRLDLSSKAVRKQMAKDRRSKIESSEGLFCPA